MTHKGKTVEFCTTIQLDSQSILTRSTLLHRQECPGNSLWAPIKESKFRNGGARQEPFPQEMQKAPAGFRPRALALVFKPPPLNPVARVILAEGRC